MPCSNARSFTPLGTKQKVTPMSEAEQTDARAMHQLEDIVRMDGALTQRLHFLVPMLIIKEQLFEWRQGSAP